MSVIRMALMGIRRGWDDVATRYRLRRLPAVPAVLLVLAAGLVIPQLAKMGQLPADLSGSLAQERIERYLTRHRTAAADLGPGGTILAARPAFHWPATAGADHYVFRLVRAGGTAWISDKVVREPVFRMRPPGQLTGGSYRFEAKAVDAAGAVLDTKSGTFTVAEPTDELKKLRRMVRYELSPAAGALVLMGYYAEHDSHDDVNSAALAYAAAAAKESGAPSLEGRAQTWLAARIGKLSQSRAN